MARELIQGKYPNIVGHWPISPELSKRIKVGDWESQHEELSESDTGGDNGRILAVYVPIVRRASVDICMTASDSNCANCSEIACPFHTPKL